MKNIFFKNIPGLFKRKKKITAMDQPYHYNSKVLETLRQLESNNEVLVKNVLGLNTSTSEIEKTVINIVTQLKGVREEQSTSFEKLFTQISEENEDYIEKLDQVKGFLYENQQKQETNLSEHLKQLHNRMEQMKVNNEKSTIDRENEFEALHILLDGLYKRADQLQMFQKDIFAQLTTLMKEINQEIDETNGIQIENDKTNTDLLIKLREQYIQNHLQQNDNNERLEAALEDVQNELQRLADLIKKQDQLINQ